MIPAVSHNNIAQTNAINGGLMNGFEKVSGCQKKKNYRCYTQFHRTRSRRSPTWHTTM